MCGKKSPRADNIFFYPMTERLKNKNKSLLRSKPKVNVSSLFKPNSLNNSHNSNNKIINIINKIKAHHIISNHHQIRTIINLNHRTMSIVSPNNNNNNSHRNILDIIRMHNPFVNNRIHSNNIFHHTTKASAKSERKIRQILSWTCSNLKRKSSHTHMMVVKANLVGVLPPSFSCSFL